jgi:hypothetical protein
MTRMREFSGVASVGKAFLSYVGPSATYSSVVALVKKKTEGEYQCEACPISFGTQRALSTHEKHAHPTLRNTKRRGTDPPSKNWKVEEISLLRKLEEEFKNYGYPNVEISKILTGRSMDQLNIRGENLNWPVRERALSRLIRRQREDAISLTQAIHD